ncbi:hypothetical protein ONZ45_g7029 [Pleurotus djamor]|nr:hypothetical protein ONZ45_g7029 [Pleurotus djamor]
MPPTRRIDQPYVQGVGPGFSSPKFKRAPERYRQPYRSLDDGEAVKSHFAALHQSLFGEDPPSIRLKTPAPTVIDADADVDMGSEALDPTPDNDIHVDDPLYATVSEMDTDEKQNLQVPSHRHAKKYNRDAVKDNLYANWKGIIPSLVPPWLEFQRKNLSKPVPHPPSSITSNCDKGCSETSQQSISLTALFFDWGGDFHVAVDGNFHHRQRKGVADSPWFYEPQYILPKAQIDAVGERIIQARIKTKRSGNTTIPGYVQHCKDSHRAANEDSAKSDSAVFASHGLMALVCRHDCPLFAANIDTPGEAQKYAIALIEHFFSLIPQTSNVVLIYDIGCVLDHSLKISIRSRLQFATSAMHAYGHQWTCQLEYNPRMKVGLGLTDGEGVERLWSLLRKLIGITRNAGSSRRLWLEDRQLMFITATIRKELGRWIKNRADNGINPKRADANRDLVECALYTLSQLKGFWEDQKQSQMSANSHESNRLKRGIDAVLKLQADLETLRNGVGNTVNLLKKLGQPQKAKRQVPDIDSLCEKIEAQIEEIYVAMNLPEVLPTMTDVPFPIVKQLLTIREIKNGIRERAISTFFEWERLDQAVGGRGEALGTRLHQQTRNAISKRTPALRASIKKYNEHCDALEATLEELGDKEKPCIPIPKRLPTDLYELRDSDDLMEDIWIDDTREAPLWLTDASVRRGIRAMLKLERCTEEDIRLTRETDNMRQWLAREVGATEYALRDPKFQHLHVPLSIYSQSLHALPSHWASHRLTRTSMDSILNQVLNALEPITPTPQVTEIKPLLIPTLGDDNTIDEVIVEDFDGLDGEGLDGEIVEDANALSFHDFLTDNVFDDPEPYDQPDTMATIEEAEVPYSDDDMDDDDQNLSFRAPSTRLGSPWGGLATTDHRNVDGSTSDEEIEIVSVVAPTPVRVKAATPYLDWSLLPNIRLDKNILHVLQSLKYDSSPTDHGAVLVRTLSGHEIVVERQDIQALKGRMSWLNQTCINSCAALLQNTYGKDSEFAIFDTYALVLIKEGATDETLRRKFSHTQFWSKNKWIIPIHRPQPDSHWVLCVADLLRKRYSVFDSFGSPVRWAEDLEVEAVQTTDYDCGVWVIIAIAATLRGYDAPAVPEGDISIFRAIFASWLERQPRL